MTGVKERELRSYVSEPNRGRRKWKNNRDAQKPTYDNRRRIWGHRGKRLLRQRGEKLERGFAHMLGSGGLRRVHTRGQEEIRKRMLIHAAAFNLGLLMRKRFGVGTPRALQGLATWARNSAYNSCLALFPPYSAPLCLPWAEYRLFRPPTPLLAQQCRARASVFSPSHHPLGSHFLHGLLGGAGDGSPEAVLNVDQTVFVLIGEYHRNHGRVSAARPTHQEGRYHCG